MSRSLGRRPPELDDRAWLAARYERDGDTRIARELGVSNRTVRAARARHGIGSHPPGRRRGLTAAGPVETVQIEVSAELAAIITAELSPNGPAPSPDLLSGRVRDAHEALSRGDETAARRALLHLAAGACLLAGERTHRAA